MKTRSLAVLALVAAATAPLLALGADKAKKPAPIPRDEAIASCVKNREKAYECKEQFIDAMIDMRMRHMPQLAKAGSTPEGRAELKQIGLREITEDGSGDLAPRQAKCGEMFDHMKATPAREQLDAMAACEAKTDCGERVACMVPLMEKMMFGKKAAK